MMISSINIARIAADPVVTAILGFSYFKTEILICLIQIGLFIQEQLNDLHSTLSKTTSNITQKNQHQYQIIHGQSCANSILKHHYCSFILNNRYNDEFL